MEGGTHSYCGFFSLKFRHLLFVYLLTTPIKCN